MKEKDEDVPKEVLLAKKIFMLKKIRRYSVTLKVQKNKMLEANPNLERSMKICQGREKMLSLHFKLHHEESEESPAQTTPYLF